MRVRDLMTPDPACCTPQSTAREAAAAMRDNDCGSIPVVESTDTRRLVGVVTDRDLAVRGLAQGRGAKTAVEKLMTVQPVTCIADDEVETVREVMIRQRVRRVPVVDQDGRVVGIVAQADLALDDGAATDRDVGQIVEAISRRDSGDLREG